MSIRAASALPTAMFCSCVALAMHAGPARASTVAPMTIRELADLAGQVIAADVAAVQSYWHQARGRIETRVTLANVEYWKGEHPGATNAFTLVVPGGTLGKRQMRVCCAPHFEPGQRRVLFLLPEYKTFPTVGLGQGAFLVRQDAAGVDRVYVDGGFAVTGFDDDGYPLLTAGGDQPGTHAAQPGGRAPAAAKRRHAKSQPAAEPAANSPRCVQDRLRGSSGPVVRDATAAAAEPMTLAGFRSHVQPILDASRDHQMSRPAGEPLLVRLQPTSLKLSPRQNAIEEQTPVGEPSASRRGKGQVDAAEPATPRPAKGRNRQHRSEKPEARQ